jgi:hypothetical protein
MALCNMPRLRVLLTGITQGIAEFAELAPDLATTSIKVLDISENNLIDMASAVLRDHS